MLCLFLNPVLTKTTQCKQITNRNTQLFFLVIFDKEKDLVQENSCLLFEMMAGLNMLDLWAMCEIIHCKTQNQLLI